MSDTLLIRNVRPAGGTATDVLVRDGRIAAIGPGAAGAGAEVTFDAGGRLLIPGLVEAHTHLDKSFWGMGWQRHTAGPTLIDKIETERRNRRELGIDADRQSGRLVAQMVRMGTTHIRSHVDVDTETGLAGIEGVMAMRERLKNVIDVEIVAFAQSGLLIRPGTLDLVDRAMAMGAEVVGGLDPCAVDRDPKGHLDAIFGLAQKYGRPLDIHLHERGEMGAFSMELTLERVRALGMQGKVAISHAFCLGMPDVDHARRLIDELAAERIALVTTAPAASPAPSVTACLKAGVVIAGGSDGVRDSWNPYGMGDMLERATLVGLRNNFRRDEEMELALDVCTYQGAKVMGIADYGLDIGCTADLVILPGETLCEAIVERPGDRTVVKRGKIVARHGELAQPIA
ncbi:MAG: amidohydrolase family protein [Bosea sp.]|uniref:amidohydrolase family protein n=1 Tax=Bosea sp. (in: a-proteobacteria) TaxID=1871050 RepID=UPI001AD5441F|nr:amidohydrolase family protein [Bosea sp. (in: a-proteobacteria)]MBN9451434.1 amidohydrolase family protein [Bosea sp. (in: a-proteobacteria)]